MSLYDDFRKSKTPTASTGGAPSAPLYDEFRRVKEENAIPPEVRRKAEEIAGSVKEPLGPVTFDASQTSLQKILSRGEKIAPAGEAQKQTTDPNEIVKTTFGNTLKDLARKVLPSKLEDFFGISPKSSIEKRIEKWGDDGLNYARTKELDDTVREVVKEKYPDGKVRLPADYKEPEGFWGQAAEGFTRAYIGTIKPVIGTMLETANLSPESVAFGRKMGDRAVAELVLRPELAPPEDLPEFFKGGYADRRWWGGAVGGAVPSIASALAAGTAAAIVTRNPAAATNAAWATTFAMEKANSYRDMLDKGIAPDKANKASTVYGAISAQLEIGMGINPGALASRAVLGRGGEGIITRGLADSFLKYIDKTLVKVPTKVLINALQEGNEEAAQQFTQNLITGFLYDPQGLTEGVAESWAQGFAGGLPFGAADVVTDFRVGGQQQIPPDVRPEEKSAIEASMREEAASALKDNHTPDEVERELKTQFGISAPQAERIVQRAAEDAGIKIGELEGIGESDQVKLIEELSSTIESQKKEELAPAQEATLPTNVLDIMEEFEDSQEARDDWDNNYAEEYGDLVGRYQEIQKQIRETKDKEQKKALTEKADDMNAEIKKIEQDFIGRYEAKARVLADERSEEDVEKLSRDINDAYATVGNERLDEELTYIVAQMEVSEPGQRFQLEDGTFSGTKSSFPKWIPEHLRRKELFEKVFDSLEAGKIRYPDGNRPKQRELYDAILQEADTRLGVNTSEIRAKILGEYERRKNQKDAGVVDSGPSGRSRPSRERGRIEGQVAPASLDDISAEEANVAHAGTSFDPEKRGQAEREDFVRIVNGLYSDLLKLANTDLQRELLDVEFSRFKETYKNAFTDYLNARARTVSPMITGRANFNVAKNKKAIDAQRKKGERLDEIVEKARKSISRKLREVGIEEAGGRAVVLQRDLEGEKQLLSDMKVANAIIRKKDMSDEEKISKIVADTELTEEQARSALSPDYMGRIGFQDFALSNLRARIKTKEDKMKRDEESSGKSGIEILGSFDGGTISINYDDDRVRIIFDSKPDSEVINSLKTEGWKWSPSNSAWQRQNTQNAILSAKRLFPLKASDIVSAIEEPSTIKYRRVPKSLTEKKSVVEIRAKSDDVPFDMSQEEGRRWVESIFGKSVDFLLSDAKRGTVLSDQGAWGTYTPRSLGRGPVIHVVTHNGRIQSKAVYHESFHAFLDLAVTDKERKELLSNVRKNPLTAPMRAVLAAGYKNVKDVPNTLAEEWLANDFARFVEWELGISDGKRHIAENEGIYQKMLRLIREFVRRITGAQKVYIDILTRHNLALAQQERQALKTSVLETFNHLPEFQDVDANGVLTTAYKRGKVSTENVEEAFNSLKSQYKDFEDNGANGRPEILTKFFRRVREHVDDRGVPDDMDVFLGFDDLTTRILGKLEGRDTVSKQFIQDLTNSPDLKQAERDLFRRLLEEEGDVVKVKDFANKVKSELLPLERNFIEPSYENITLSNDLRGPVANYHERVYESPIKTSAGGTHFNKHDVENYFAHTRIEDLPVGENKVIGKDLYGDPIYDLADQSSGVGGIRRVIELQSDLFQKGRLEGEVKRTTDWINADLEGVLTPSELKEWRALGAQKHTQLLKESPDNSIIDGINTKLKPLQEKIDVAMKGRGQELAKLEPYRNTWHERVIREEVKQAAKDGKTKLQFPTGETIMKIEGLGEANNTRWRTAGNGHILKSNELKVGQEINSNGQSDWIITDVLGDGKFKAVPKNRVLGFGMTGTEYTQWIDDLKNGFDAYGQRLAGKNGIKNPLDDQWVKGMVEARRKFLEDSSESFDISGKVDSNNPIYKFYEKEIGRYLRNRYDAKRITDAQGVEWWEVTVDPAVADEPVNVFYKKASGAINEYAIRPETKLEGFRRKVQDQNARIQNVQKQLEEQGAVVNDETDVFLSKTLLPRRTGAAFESFKKKIEEPFVASLVANGLTVADMDSYSYALHAPRRNVVMKERGYEGDNGSGITDEQAGKILSDFEAQGKTVALERHREMLRDVQRASLGLMLQEGLMTKEEVQAWYEVYGKDYVPLGRIMDDVAGSGIGTGGRRGVDVRGKESKRAVGSEREVLPVTAQIFNQYRRAVMRSEQNRVAKALYGFIVSNNENGEMNGLFRVFKQQYIPRFDADGELLYMDPQWVTHPNVIGLKRDGKQYYIEIKDNKYARAIKEAGLSKGFSTAAMYIQFLSSMITRYSPEFIFRNAQRDFFEGMINLREIRELDIPETERSGLARKVSAKVPSMIKDLYRSERGTKTRNDELFERFKKSGGEVGYFWSVNAQEAMTNLQKLEARYRNEGFEKIKNPVRMAGEFINAANTAVELGIRVAIFDELTQRGMSEKKAAAVAGDITVDFNKVGEWGPLLKSLYVFVNPAIQGPARLFRAVGRSSAVRKSVVAMTIAGFAAGIISMMLGGDADDDIPEYIKNTRIVFATPEGKSVTLFFLPYGYNVFWGFGRNMAELMMGKKTIGETTTDTLLAGLDSFNPLGGSELSFANLAPTQVKPLVDISINEGWYGGPIMPEQPFYGAHIPDSQLYWESVSNTSKFIAKMLNSFTGGDERKSGAIDISPESIDYAVASYGGSVFQLIKNSFDATVSVASGQELKAANIPFVRDYYRDIDTARAKRQVIYPMLEESGRKEFSDMQVSRYDSAVDALLKEGEIDESYAEKLKTDLRENQNMLEEGMSIQNTKIKQALESMEAGTTRADAFSKLKKDVLGEDSEPAAVTSLKKSFAVFETFGFDDKNVERLRGGRNNAERAQILVDMRNEMGDEAFLEFFRKARKTVSGSGGNDVYILISDDLRAAYIELRRED